MRAEPKVISDLDPERVLDAVIAVGDRRAAILDKIEAELKAKPCSCPVARLIHQYLNLPENFATFAIGHPIQKSTN
jgi:hypothetical protein